MRHFGRRAFLESDRRDHLPCVGDNRINLDGNEFAGLARTILSANDEIVIDEVTDLFDWPWTGFSTPLWAVPAALGVLAATVWWGG